MELDRITDFVEEIIEIKNYSLTDRTILLPLLPCPFNALCKGHFYYTLVDS